MGFYMRQQSLPELKELTPSEATLVWHACVGRLWRKPAMWGVALASLMTTLAVTVFGVYLSIKLELLHSGSLIAFFFTGFGSGMIGMVVGCMVFMVLRINVVRPVLRAYIAEKTDDGDSDSLQLDVDQL